MYLLPLFSSAGFQNLSFGSQLKVLTFYRSQEDATILYYYKSWIITIDNIAGHRDLELYRTLFKVEILLVRMV